MADRIPLVARGNQKVLIKEKKAIYLWCLTIWFVVMNTTMFNVALPNILEDFKLTEAEGSWVVSGYSIILAISTITFSRLSDYIPVRRLITVGLILIGLASVLGFMANQYYLLLTARLLQAVGAGAASGLAFVFVGKHISSLKRAKSMAMIVSASSLGFGLGPLVGGVVTSLLGWKFLFIVTGVLFLFLPLFQDPRFKFPVFIPCFLKRPPI